MGRTKKKESEKSSVKPMRPALTPEARENQLISLAMDEAEKRLRDGTASSQLVTHFLKLGSIRGKLENDILKEQRKLVTAKTEDLKSTKRIEELYSEAMKSMMIYSGRGDSDDEYY